MIDSFKKKIVDQRCLTVYKLLIVNIAIGYKTNQNDMLYNIFVN